MREAKQTPLEPGDPITVIYTRSRHSGMVAHLHVASVYGHLFATRGGLNYAFSREGVTWIRGHHDNDSSAARALIAARCLYFD